MSYGFGGELQQLVEDELAKGVLADEIKVEGRRDWEHSHEVPQERP